MNKKGLKRLDKHLQSRDAGEPYALDYLKRLNQSGLDIKGQTSTAFAQSGIGLSLSASFDFGSIAGPGVHLVPAASLSGARTAHGLFVLSRMPKRVWSSEVILPKCARFPAKGAATPQKYPHASWNTQYPVTLAFLRGHTLDFDADLSAGAWVGFGAAFDTDETGATAGLQFKAGGSGTFTGLRDPDPGQYRGPYSKSLKEAVTAHFKDGVKRKAAGWLHVNGAGPKSAQKAGAPSEKPRSWKRWLRRTTGQVHDAVAIDTANVWDTHDTSIVNRGLGGAFKSLAGGLANLVHNLAGNNLQTHDLIERLEKAETLYTDFAWSEEALGRAAHQKLVTPLGGRRHARVPPKYRTPAIKEVYLRAAEARKLIAALEDARDLRGELSKHHTPAGRPQCMLDLTMVEGHASAQAGAQFVLPKLIREKKTPKPEEQQLDDPHFDDRQFGVDVPDHEYAYVPTGSVKLGVEAYAKRIGFRHQNHLGGRPNYTRELICTQDAVVTYRSRVATARASTTRHQLGGEKQYNLITMSYRSATAFWFNDTAKSGRRALPNGSGISFGMSILRTRIAAYVAALKARKDSDLGDLDADIQPFETLMGDQLRVGRMELRGCFRGIPDWITEDGWKAADAYVVESAFALRQPTALAMKDGRPGKILDLDPFEPLLKKDANYNAALVGLQTIRLRYRLRSDEDRTRNLFNLGWNPMIKLRDKDDDGNDVIRESVVPFMDQNNYDEDLRNFDQFKNFGDWSAGDGTLGDVTPAMISVGLERVERVGMEGIVTLHEYFPVPRYSIGYYGVEQAETLEIKHARSNAELLVPPVVLFSQ